MLEVLLLFILSHAQLVNTNLFAKVIADLMLLNKDFARPILVLETFFNGKVTIELKLGNRRICVS